MISSRKTQSCEHCSEAPQALRLEKIENNLSLFCKIWLTKNREKSNGSWYVIMLSCQRIHKKYHKLTELLNIMLKRLSKNLGFPYILGQFLIARRKLSTAENWLDGGIHSKSNMLHHSAIYKLIGNFDVFGARLMVIFQKRNPVT